MTAPAGLTLTRTQQRSAAARKGARTRRRLALAAGRTRLCSTCRAAPPRPGRSECASCHALDMRERRVRQRSVSRGTPRGLRGHVSAVLSGILSEAA